MTDHKVFKKLAELALEDFRDKPTALTPSQQEALQYFGLLLMGIVKLEYGNANQAISQQIVLPRVNIAT